MNLPTKPVHMTRPQAEALSRAINRVRTTLVSSIRATQRKRSWSDAQKAMAIGEDRLTLEVISKFQDELQQAHCIGGY